MYINKVTLYGRLGKDPELKAMPNGGSVVNFTMATTREWKDDAGKKQEQTEWHNVVCFGKRAEVIARWVKKGDKFYVEGRNQTRSWEDKDNKKMYRTEVVVEDFMFGDNPKKEGGTQRDTSTHESSEPMGDGIDYPADDINPEDIPF